jgi:hypothetical protein
MSGFSYAVVETALANAFGADGIAQKRAFRGRLQHLRRLGLPSSGGVGRGKAITYTKANIFEIGFCLECEEIGVAPALAVNVLERQHAYILHAYERAEQDFPTEWFFWFSGLNFMSTSWSKEKRKIRGLPEMGSGPMRGLEGEITRLSLRSYNRRVAVFSMAPLVKAAKDAK